MLRDAGALGGCTAIENVPRVGRGVVYNTGQTGILAPSPSIMKEANAGANEEDSQKTTDDSQRDKSDDNNTAQGARWVDQAIDLQVLSETRRYGCGIGERCP